MAYRKFDPNLALDELREFYNLVQDDELTAEHATTLAILFDDLDNHIISGGQLPKEWQR